MPAPVTRLKLDRQTEERIQRLAAARHQTPDAILRQALDQYLASEKNPPAKNYPARSPVGGIITPV